MSQTSLFTEELGITWLHASVCDPRCLTLFKRHYSHQNKARHGISRGNLARFAGPGEVMLLLTPACDALFVWRRERFRRDRQEGINCAVFRNEGERMSSLLIREGCRLAWQRWPGQRLFTFVNPRAIRSTNPGYCFKAAGWSPCGHTKKRRLLIFDIHPGNS